VDVCGHIDWQRYSAVSERCMLLVHRKMIFMVSCASEGWRYY